MAGRRGSGTVSPAPWPLGFVNTDSYSEISGFEDPHRPLFKTPKAIIIQLLFHLSSVREQVFCPQRQALETPFATFCFLLVRLFKEPGEGAKASWWETGFATPPVLGEARCCISRSACLPRQATGNIPFFSAPVTKRLEQRADPGWTWFRSVFLPPPRCLLLSQARSAERREGHQQCHVCT